MPLYNNPDFRRLPSGLAAVFDKSRRQSFFDLPEWYDVLARFGVPTGTQIRVYTDERQGAGVAALFQVCNDAGRRCLASLANYYSVEHGLVAGPGADLDGGLTAILSEIQAERPRWDCLRLTELDPGDGGYDALVRALRGSGLLVECAPGAPTWYERTDRLTFADYLARRPSQLRSTWRRKRRAVEAAGGLTARFVAETSGIDAAIADYEAVYAASWKPPEPFPRFTPELIRAAAGLGALRLGIYYLDRIPAAAQFWIVWQGRATIYKLAHDQRFNTLSLGTLLTMEMIERVMRDDRPLEINLGRGDDAYKRLWLSKRRERWGITASNPRSVRGLRLGLEREAAKLYHRLRGEPTRPPASGEPAIARGDLQAGRQGGRG